jgi:VWFA-related protein
MRQLLLLALAAAALAQAPIQVTTRLVQVAVVVRDKQGAVADLTKGDFEVLDKGKSRPIATFSIARATDRVPRAPLPPNTFSNHLDQQGDAPVTATVLLFDSLNTAFKDQADARKQALAFLKSIDPASPVAIYALGNNLRILHDFTQDQARLARALEGYRNGTSTLLQSSQPDPLLKNASDPDALSIVRAVDPSGTVSGMPAGGITQPGGGGSGPDTTDLLAQMMQPLQAYAIDRRVAITLSAMQAIADRMAGVPGRKNLIWISGGFPLTLAFDRRGVAGGGQNLTTYAGPMKEAAMAIDRANVSVYPVDARGLIVSSTIREAMPAPRNQGASGATYNLPPSESLNNTREIDTMKLLAEWTGGRAFYNSNDIRGAVKQALEDAEVTYTLGFYPEEKELDGTYHELKVKVARKGADTRYRKGYFATPLTPIHSQPAIDVLRNAVASPADSTGMGLTASVSPAPEAPGTYVLALAIDLHNLSLESRNNRWADDVNFLVVQQAAGGLLLDSVGNTIHINVTEENRQLLVKDGLVLRLAVKPAPGLSQIRVAVMDGATGNVGSLRVLPPQ